MNIHASPAPQRDAPGHGGAAANAPLPHEIQYRQDAASYVAVMLAELRQIAGKAGFDKLVSALDAAYYEAYSLMGQRAAAPAAEQPEKISDRVEPNGS